MPLGWAGLRTTTYILRLDILERSQITYGGLLIRDARRVQVEVLIATYILCKREVGREGGIYICTYELVISSSSLDLPTYPLPHPTYLPTYLHIEYILAILCPEMLSDASLDIIRHHPRFTAIYPVMTLDDPDVHHILSSSSSSSGEGGGRVRKGGMGRIVITT